MPFDRSYMIGTSAKLWLWKLTETEAVLAEGMEKYPRLAARLSKIKSSNQRKGIWAVQRLLLQAGIDPQSMQHDTNGIPRLPDQHISISHARGYAAIAVGTVPMGVDVEQIREQVHRIVPKFVHPSELFAQSTAERIQLWTAKEAVYKAIEWPGLQLNQQLIIAPFDQQAATVVHHQEKKQLKLYFYHLEQHKATVALLQS